MGMEVPYLVQGGMGDSSMTSEQSSTLRSARNILAFWAIPLTKFCGVKVRLSGEILPGILVALEG